MLILGIESSCDDTAAAVVKNGKTVLSSVTSSQHEIHSKYGGIVPELASRRHIENIPIVIAEAVELSGIALKDLDAIAVTQGPGLLGALLVGIAAAKGLAWAEKKPLVPVHHLHGHIVAAGLNHELRYPHLCLVVSGGHTSLFKIDSPVEFFEISSTRDDAAGEAFDKVAKMLGLGFPGGPAVEKEAVDGDPLKLQFSVPNVKNDPLAFSFSGMKTAVRNAMKSSPKTCDVAAAFQATVVKTLVTKTMLAAEKLGLKDIVLAGGVACNKALRTEMERESQKRGFHTVWPEPKFCTDNGAMIALAGHHIFLNNTENPDFRNFLALDGEANLKLPPPGAGQ
ncbi:MAG: tRNA (adenosine(37)-N6)-threonylcarbamoyltransferase complex transferase subunit TsaD [Nitrospinota bacterium]|nr:tRNA (adenosine(37)-N6)-threonylcarbamoyltransferase complex transferase subunit TsaD [Nitrospinota bacterium]